jgi:hypothetical protein
LPVGLGKMAPANLQVLRERLLLLVYHVTMRHRDWAD